MNLKELQHSPAAFRQALKIDADGQSVRLGDKLDDWQKRDFEQLDSGWQSVTGQNQTSTSLLRGWLERPRGHSKTSDIAAMATWALFASKRKLTGYAAAASKDQSRLLRDAIAGLVRINNWLNQILEISNYRIANRHTGSTLDILSADVATSYGLLPDFVICDELCHWHSRDLWDSLISASAKRKSCVVVVISNAGFSESWQWQTREAVRSDPSWYFSRLDGPQASWITPDRLDEQRRLLPSIAYRRLWLNEWSQGSGDALQPDDIDRAVTLAGPLTEAEDGYCYVAGVDLGLSRDASSVAVIGRHVGHVTEHKKPKRLSSMQRAMIEAGILDMDEDEYHETIIPPTGKLKLAAVKLWKPTAGNRVSVEGIEKAIIRLDEQFQLSLIGFDPWNSAQLSERLRNAGIPTEDVPFQAANLRSMCTAVLEAFTEGTIELYHHPQLIQDLRNLRVEERAFGCRLTSPRSASGHGDAATALAIALHLANRISIASHVHNATLITYP